MNDLIQSLPSPWPTAGDYSLIDGGNMDGRWRSDGDDDGDDLLQFPVPAGCQNGVSGAVSWNLVGVAERNSF